jgi:hypothetical protein
MNDLMMPTLLPTLGLDERRMVEYVATWVGTVRHMLDKQYSGKRLEELLRQALREGGLTIAIKAVEAADKDDEIADSSLRQVYAEMAGGTLAQRGPGHLQIWAYGQRAVLRPPNKRPRGRRWYDDWYRNLGICFLIAIACREFCVLPTRNRESRRDGRTPSGISLVVAALALNGIHIDEASVQRHIWLGLPGELARHAIKERPLESWLESV